jgi:hypothetical protein
LMVLWMWRFHRTLWMKKDGKVCVCIIYNLSLCFNSKKVLDLYFNFIFSELIVV